MSTRIGVVVRPQLPPEALRDAVVQAEQAGVDDVWLWEDCFLTGGPTAAVAALAATERVRVGLGLMPVPLRNAALTAMEIATVERLFPGRFAPALGHGVQEWMTQVGAGVGSPLTLLREHTGAVRSLLRGEQVDVAGRYVRLDGVRLDWPPRQSPPLLLGARGPRTLRLAGELADGVVLDDPGTGPSALTPTRVAAAVAEVRAGRESVDHGPTSFEVVAYVVPGSDPVGHALALVEAGVTTLVLQPPHDQPGLDATLLVAEQVRAALTA